MKLSFLSIAICLFWGSSLQAQISDQSVRAQSIEQGLQPTLEVEDIQVDLQRLEAQSNTHELLYRAGYVVPLSYSLGQGGQWQELNNGDRIWFLRLKSSGAKALNLYFSEFRLAPGCLLHVYSPDKEQVLGAFAAQNNHSSKLFATELIHGDELILEYYEPLAQRGKSSLLLDGLGYMYRKAETARRDFGSSASCQINVNCPEGSGKEAQRDATARILVRVGANQGWCTGSLINNARQDGTPYFLTAEHCGITSTGSLASAGDFNQWVFYFNYQASACANPGSEPNAPTITGALVRANSNDNGGNTGSDMLLLELNTTPPSNYNGYYAGWDRSTTAPGSGYGIHHPAGDIKKISSFSAAARSVSYSGIVANTHWELNWVSTASGHGVTEGGSSGSALFNSAGLIVGSLTGGGASCNNQSAPDEYGKFSYHWQSNGLTANRRLSNWLDPDNSGIQSLQGSYDPLVSSTSSLEAAEEQIKIYPNPSSSEIQVEVPQDGLLQIFDMQGRLVESQVLKGEKQLSITISSYSAGLYLLVFDSELGRVSKKFVKN